ncbi:MAG: four helix bundle protein [Nitrospirota bacterium]|nr:four helix bundle protein [Nitrospirota bacterium]
MAAKSDIRSFRDLEIWVKGIALVKTIYDLTRHFPKNELFGLTSQIQRAAVSIPSNIAEGHTRGHRAEFRQFLFVALGSLAELETQIIIASELCYLDSNIKAQIIEEMEVLGKQIRTLISKLTPSP